jgi:hypothetical protein
MGFCEDDVDFLSLAASVGSEVDVKEGAVEAYLSSFEVIASMNICAS